MSSVEELKQKIGNTRLPNNSSRILELVDNMDKLKLEADRLLVKLSYESLASMMLGEANLTDYKETANGLSNDIYKAKKLIDREIPGDDETYLKYEGFYHEVQMVTDEYSSPSADLIIDMDDMSENSQDILRRANDKATINEFKRFS